jgi:hypothetical protein
LLKKPIFENSQVYHYNSVAGFIIIYYHFFLSGRKDMKIKTKGKCIKCGKLYTSITGSSHLTSCIPKNLISSDSTTEGYLVRISWTEQPNLYWMFVTIPKNVTLSLLDQYLRDSWLECCDHLSKFTINGLHYMSYLEPGYGDLSMNKQIKQILSPGLRFTYAYDFGSSTDLTLKVIETIPACPPKNITLFIQNDPPLFSCESCKKPANIICSLCGETICDSCGPNHSCALEIGDTSMLMQLVNSPRTGVCAYE